METKTVKFERLRKARAGVQEALTAPGFYQSDAAYGLVDAAQNGTDALQQICHSLSVKSGWWNGVDVNDKNVLGCKIALMHSEASEMLEGVRKDKMDDHLPHRKAEEVEAADLLIRLMDYAGARGLDIAGAAIEKLAYNQQRADHKPEARAAEGGKKI